MNSQAAQTRIARSTFFGLAVLGVIVVLAVTLPFAREYLTVDTCLDRGGSFDYSNGTCDLKASHPFSPRSERHPFAFPALVIGGVLVLVSAVALLGVRMHDESRSAPPAS